MIKRFCFGVSGAPADPPASVRPLRMALNSPTDGRGDGFLVQWFEDPAALARYEAWDGAAANAAVVVAEEVVQRGGDWLGSRWADAGPRWKHVALATRAPGLTPAEFSKRWRGHGGRAPTQGGDAPIPQAARGQAYAQNHPLPRGGEWLYDAITEVWFDDRRDLETRAAWFDANVRPDELFGEMRFLSVREVPLPA